MIIGCPCNPYRTPLHGAFWPIMLDLELRLVDYLKRSGHEPIYKSHPDRLEEVDGVFEGRCKVIKRRISARSRDRYFQRLMEKMDIILFTAITTTSFPFALCSAKPIVALDLSFKWSVPFPEPMELLKKRIKIVSTTHDERNRIIFNEEELLNALNGR